MRTARAVLFVSCVGVPAFAQEVGLALEAVPLALEPSAACAAFAETADDRLWIAFLDRLVWHDGTAMGTVDFQRRDGTIEARGLRHLVARPDGSLLVAANSGLWKVARGANEGVPLPLGERFDLITFTGTTDGRGWLLGRDQLQIVHADDRVAPAAMPGGVSFVDLVADGTSVWAWSNRTLFLGTWRDDRPEWHRVGNHDGIVVAHAHGGELTAVDAEGLVRIARDGVITRLRTHAGWTTARGLVRGRDGYWLHSLEHLWHVPFDSRPIRQVELLHHERFLPPPLQAVYEDRQGLLWTGNRTAVRRALRHPGIDNLVFPAPLRDDAVSALVEVGDTVWLGTDEGTLLRLCDDAWQEVTPPWSTALPAGTASVVAMAVDASGALYVASRRAGVFRRAGDGWEPWLAPDDNVRSLVPAPDGGMWCTFADVLERRDEEGATTRLRIAQGERPAVISDAVALPDGSFLVTCFRNRQGLQSLTHPGAPGRAFAMDWDGESVQRVLPSKQPGSAWVATLTGLWRVDLARQTRSRELTTNTSQWLRNLVPDGPDAFWATTLHDLHHIRIGTVGTRWIGAEGGAHPRPFAQRSAMRRSNGEHWFGTLGGYSRVTTQADKVFAWEPLAIRVAIGIGGRVSPEVRQGELRATAWVDDGPIQLLPTVVDRSPAPASGWRVGLRDAWGNLTIADDATFDRPGTGPYTAILRLRHPWGAERDFVLGTIEIRQRPATWPWWVAASLLLAGLLTTGWRSLQRSAQRARRRLHLEPALAAGWPRPKEILDIAHVAIAATETLVRDGRTEHATVWLVRTSDDRRLPIAEFGPALADANELARRCLTDGHCLHGHVFWLADSERRTACMQIRGGTLVNVEILLHGIACVDEAAMQKLEAACAPVAAAIDKQVWLDRLEQEFIDRSSTFDAEAHDLRSALTTLRLSAFTLSQAPADAPMASVRADAQRIGRSCDHIVKALETMLHQVNATQSANLAQRNPFHVLRSRIEQHEASARAKELRLEVVGDDRDASAWLDEFLFARVIDNVLGNAIKYSPPGSVIRIHCEPQPAAFLIHVDDEGPGFPAGQHEAVFLAGVIGKARPTGDETQTGLGLWIARKAMRAMHGDVWIENREAAGARVSLWLPRQRAQ